MSLAEADDFLAECEILHALLERQPEKAFARTTEFKQWTVDDVLVHLHFWNQAADLAFSDAPAFQRLAGSVGGAVKAGRLRTFENAAISDRGHALLRHWIGFSRTMARNWRDADPRTRIPWIGPSMSARSAITARQMETWAHGFEVFDAFGEVRCESDRVRNIVVLGVNTFAWSHQVNGIEVPGIMPYLRLTAPSGAVWEFGDPQSGSIEGPATDFAAVVTQTRALADTSLAVTGDVAMTWMAHAQCFAGPPEAPPLPGSRSRSGEQGSR